MDIIHYCCGSYDGGNYGGVARYDYHIKLIFPNRKFFKGPAQKNKMVKYLKSRKNPIVITDNHLSNDIPNEYPCVLVHHGSALTHAKRDPLWRGFFKNICTNGQKKMLNYRSPKNTIIISISSFCSTEFLNFFPKKYPLFKKKLIFHTSELNEKKFRKSFHKKPIILGNWKTDNKGKRIVNFISKQREFYFRQLNVSIKNGNIQYFNNRKQQIYCECDMFLQLSKCEGNSYATLDALLCGLVVVSTNVGLFFKDVPNNCFVKIPWKKINNINFIKNRINFAWKNRHKLANNSRKWYLEKCSFYQWKNNMINTISNFYNKQYNKDMILKYDNQTIKNNSDVKKEQPVQDVKDEPVQESKNIFQEKKVDDNKINKLLEEELKEEESVQEVKDEPVQDVKYEPVQDVKDEPILEVKDEPILEVKDEPVLESKNIFQEEEKKVNDNEINKLLEEEVKDEPVLEVKEEQPVLEVKDEPVLEVKDEPVQDVKYEPVLEVKEEPVLEVKEEESVLEVKEEPVLEVKDEPVLEVKDEPVLESKNIFQEEESVLEVKEDEKIVEYTINKLSGKDINKIKKIFKEDNEIKKLIDDISINHNEKKYKTIDELLDIKTIEYKN